MLDFIKNYENIITILLLVLIIVLVFLFIKFEFLRIACITVLSILYMLFSLWCGFQVNNYYSSTGGILGEITSIVRPNQLIVQNLKLNLKYSELTLKDDGKYSLQTSSDEVFDLTSDVGYIVLVNGQPTNLVSLNKGFVSVDYEYSFRDKENKEILLDTLHIRISLHNKATVLNVFTNGSSEAVNYWNSYFNLNDFIIEIKENPVVSTSNEVNDEYEVASPDYCCVRFFIDKSNDISDILLHQDYLINSNLTVFPEVPEIPGYTFVGWFGTVNGEFKQIEDFSIIVSSDLTFSAVYQINTCAVNLYYNDELIETIFVDYGTVITKSNFNYEIPNSYSFAIHETSSSDAAHIDYFGNRVTVLDNVNLKVYRSSTNVVN